MASSHRFVQQAISRRRFQEDTGQVFDETSATPNSVHRTWQYKTKGSLRNLSYGKLGATGAATLRDTVIRSLAPRVAGLEPAHFEYIDWGPVRPFWDFLVKSDLVSFHAWKTFTAAYPGERCLQHYRANIARFVTAGSWAVPLNAVIATDFRFVTLLEISNVGVARLDLLALPELVNLGMLTIGPKVVIVRPDGVDQIGLDDAILRSWSDGSETTAARFPCLRKIRLRGQGLLTPQSLRWASKLRGLTMFTVEGVLSKKKWLSASSLSDQAWELLETAECAVGPHETDFGEFLGATNSHTTCAKSDDIQDLYALPVLHLDIVNKEGRSQDRFVAEKLCFSRVIATTGRTPVPSHPGSTGLKRGADMTRKISTKLSARHKQLKTRNTQDTEDALAAFSGGF